ncbi:hypothetical protein QCA50_005013 [Cerrena zonata]|uniref:Uncharacterized protein n=1 Tax=Cerrena zonata TaxID=2478898 RepID=A0AAW0GPV4_9APHY
MLKIRMFFCFGTDENGPPNDAWKLSLMGKLRSLFLPVPVDLNLDLNALSPMSVSKFI